MSYIRFMELRRVSCPVALALLAIFSFRSSAQPTVAFEVASIKPQPWQGQGNVGVGVHGNTLSAEHACLNDLVEFAWNLRDVQLSGGPAWAERGKLYSSDLYQVIAKAPGDTPPTPENFRIMLRALLAERFQLRVRQTTKDLPVYNLVTAKNGPKVKESAADAKFSLNIDGTVNNGKAYRITARHVSVAQLLEHIEHSVDRPLTDKTGLTGFYDFDLEYAKENLPDTEAPSLFSALQSQLGLKLEPGTAPFDMIVIEHAEKPSAN